MAKWRNEEWKQKEVVVVWLVFRLVVLLYLLRLLVGWLLILLLITRNAKHKMTARMLHSQPYPAHKHTNTHTPKHTHWQYTPQRITHLLLNTIKLLVVRHWCCRVVFVDFFAVVFLEYCYNSMHSQYTHLNGGTRHTQTHTLTHIFQSKWEIHTPIRAAFSKAKYYTKKTHTHAQMWHQQQWPASQTI